MSNRHLARSLVLQTLFECDFNNFEVDAQILLDRNVREFAVGYRDNGFIKNLLKGVLEHRVEIDSLIAQYAPAWPIDHISNVDRNVLRIGVYELRYVHDIPPKVAINEAIELAKTFGSPSSSKFVNGVLGSLLKNIETKGGIEIRKILSDGGERQISAGGMVYHKDSDGYKFVLIKDAIGRWTFPKGKMNEGEDLEDAAQREIGEEVGLKNLVVREKLGTISIIVNEPNKAPIPKTVHYYLIEATDVKLTIPKEPELQDARWFDAGAALGLLGYENTKDIFRDGLRRLGFKVETHPADENAKQKEEKISRKH